MTKENWHIEHSVFPGLYSVFDGDGNPIVVDCNIDRARLVEAAPEMLEALEAQERAHNLKRVLHERRLISEAEVREGYDAWKDAQCRADGLREVALARFRQDSETQDLSGLPGESESDRESGTKNA